MVKKIAIPTKNDYVFRTKYKQNSRTGLLEGRDGKDKIKNFGDYTFVKRATQDTDIDRNGTIDVKKGEILGRGTAEKGRIWVKGSKKQRAYRR